MHSIMQILDTSTPLFDKHLEVVTILTGLSLYPYYVYTQL